MDNIIKKIKKYVEIDAIINDFYNFLLSLNYIQQRSINEIENILIKLNDYQLKIKDLDLITRKKNNILNLVNEVILLFNEELMNEITKKL